MLVHVTKDKCLKSPENYLTTYHVLFINVLSRNEEFAILVCHIKQHFRTKTNLYVIKRDTEFQLCKHKCPKPTK